MHSVRRAEPAWGSELSSILGAIQKGIVAYPTGSENNPSQNFVPSSPTTEKAIELGLTAVFLEDATDAKQRSTISEP